MSKWDENMEYLEAYDDASLDTVEEEEEWDEEVNRQLDILDQARMARENGEKPANEWVRRDFKDLLYQYPPLRGLRTSELQAAFLICEGTIDGVSYYKRMSLEYLRQWRGRSVPVYRLLAIPDRWCFQWWKMENRKLWGVLGKTREKKNEDCSTCPWT